VNDVGFMYEEDWETDEWSRIQERDAEYELYRQERQIKYEAAARDGFPLGPIPKVN